MESKDDGVKAIAELNGKDVGGRAIVVNEARPQEKRPQGSMHKRRF